MTLVPDRMLYVVSLEAPEMYNLAESEMFVEDTLVKAAAWLPDTVLPFTSRREPAPMVKLPVSAAAAPVALLSTVMLLPVRSWLEVTYRADRMPSEPQVRPDSLNKASAAAVS